EQLGGADAPAVADCACQGVGVAQEAVGPADLPQLHQPADVGGADGDACYLHLGDDVTAQAQLGALLRQQLRCALVPVAEVVIVSRHQMDRVVAAHQDPDNKVIPGRGHHLAVKGDHQHVLNAVQPPHQVPPVLRGVDEGTGDAGDHLLRRAVKGEYRGGTAPQGGLLSGPAQQG
ncbi:Spore maturation protein B, partial [Dysosmobacter welbionis]